MPSKLETWRLRNSLPVGIKAKLFRAELARAAERAPHRPLGGRIVGADLSGADLTALSCTHPHWGRTALEDVNFSGASLRGAVLSGVDLSCDFSSADLHDVQFLNCDLGGSDLSNANLRGAYLSETSFRGARVDGADFTGAMVHSVDSWGTRQETLSPGQLINVKGWQDVTGPGEPSLPELLEEIIPGRPELQDLVVALAADWDDTLQEAITTATALRGA